MFFSTLLIGLDIGLGIGVLFSLFLVMLRTVLPYSPTLGNLYIPTCLINMWLLVCLGITGEAKAWHYPPEVKFADEDFDEEDLRVSNPKSLYIQWNLR